MLVGQADKAAAGVCIGVGCSFSCEVGQEEEAFGAGSDLIGLLVQNLVRIDPFLFHQFRTELAREPLQRTGGGQRDPHHMPFSMNGMAEGMQSTCCIVLRSIAMAENDTGGSKASGEDPLANNTVSDGSGSAIARSRNDFAVGGEA